MWTLTTAQPFGWVLVLVPLGRMVGPEELPIVWKATVVLVYSVGLGLLLGSIIR